MNPILLASSVALLFSTSVARAQDESAKGKLEDGSPNRVVCAERRLNGVEKRAGSDLGSSIREFLDRAETFSHDQLNEEDSTGLIGTTVRARTRLVLSDSMHQRCWNDDQLTCNLLESALTEIDGQLRAIQQREGCDEKVMRTAGGLRDTLRPRLERLGNYCASLKWNLG